MDLREHIEFIDEIIKDKSITTIELDEFVKLLKKIKKDSNIKTISDDLIEWFEVFSFLLFLSERKKFNFVKSDWESKGVKFPKLKKIIDEMNNKNIFYYKQWSIGGNCHIEVTDNDDYCDFIYGKISKYLQRISKQIIETIDATIDFKIEIKKMNFYVEKEFKKFDYNFPHIILVKNDWDDFGFNTEFEMKYYPEENTIIEFGVVKILDLKHEDSSPPVKFSKLPDHFCSLGQNIEYYDKMIELGKNDYQLILKSLRDIVLNYRLKEKISKFKGYNESLLRNSEAERALELGKSYFYENLEESDEFSFKYSTKLDHADDPHEISFNFEKNPNLPFRIMALIGENGTGKTQYLAKLSLALSGRKKFIGNFYPSRPKFSKVIVLSYSPFDDFEKPHKDEKTSYVYCGLKNKNNEIDINKLNLSFIKSFSFIKNDEKLLSSWKDIIKPIVNADNFDELTKKFIDIVRNRNLIYSENLGLSTGQILIITIFTNVVANIKPESLILFDEPETYLHPNAISQLMLSTYNLLTWFDSYAILSTHSPQILQEIPSKYVRVIHRIENSPFVNNLGLESFGENIDNLTREIFGLESTNINFQRTMKRMNKNLAYEQINDLFENNLSFNAKMYLKSIQKDNANEG